ncbi:hypothetical protein Ndes2526B_g07018 [Nannochloris sp. 'desiccata']
MPLTTQFAPLSKVLSIMLPTVVMTGGLYSLFRSSWPSVSTLTSEWEQASKASYSSFPRQGSDEPATVNPFSRWRYN